MGACCAKTSENTPHKLNCSKSHNLDANNQNQDNYKPVKQKKQKKFQGQGIQIGGSSDNYVYFTFNKGR